MIKIVNIMEKYKSFNLKQLDVLWLSDIICLSKTSRCMLPGRWVQNSLSGTFAGTGDFGPIFSV